MNIMCQCERCKVFTGCTYYGSPADVDGDKAQNGEWLCELCVPVRHTELGIAIAEMRRILGEE